MSIRLATEDDGTRLYEWIQDPVVSRSGFTTHEIEWPEHKRLFEERLKDVETVLYMRYLNNPTSPFGHVQFEAMDDEAKIFLIAEGLNMGTPINCIVDKNGNRVILTTKRRGRQGRRDC